VSNIGKKGEEGLRTTLVELFIMLGVVVILVAVFVSIGSRAEASTQDILCRDSVIIRGKATITLVKNLAEFEKITPLACNLKDLGKLKGNREEVKKEIADYSAKCWWKFAEGSVPDLFKVDRKEKSCYVCYTFSVDKDLDIGTKSKSEVLPEPKLKDRDGNNISSQELTNFLVSEVYNPAIIYGGGTKNYFGIEYPYDLKINFEQDPRVIKTSRIKSTLVTGHVMDYWFKVDNETEKKINDVGVKLQLNNVGNLLVIVADDFSSMEKSDARTIIEDAHLNSNDSSYDSILILANIKKQSIRVQVGSDLSVFLKEYQINQILEKHFKTNLKNDCADETCNVKAFNDALAASVQDIGEHLTNEAERLPGISPKSYYYYLSNGGETWLMTTDIEPDRTYAITYVATSDENKWKFAGQGITWAGAASGMVVAGVAASATGVGAIPGIACIAIGGAIGWIAGNEAATSAGTYDAQIRPNNIMIVPANSISDQCTMTE